MQLIFMFVFRIFNNTKTFYKMGKGFDSKSGENKGYANNDNIFRII